MDTRFNPQETENKIYKMWGEGGYFTPKIDRSKKPFTVILPPPNANALLHLGHAMYTVEDILIRQHRMMGDPTLWLPGSDHAGFETQVVYEKVLAKEGKSRFEFDRETLFKNIWNFVQSNKSIMEGQLRKLGFSLDWSRMLFTLDKRVVETTYKTFKRMHDEGLLYRDSRLVNYCTKHGTGFSDLEVEHEEREDKLYYIEFPVEGEKEGLVIATVRPETIPGDVGVAVHPDDERYKKYVGKTAINPVNGNKLLIISDEFVKPEFGTGVVKLTPAHDENDFEICRKHKLPLIQIIGLDGRMTKEAGELVGLKVVPSREKVLELLKAKSYFKKEEPYKHMVSVCYRCGTVLEPLPLSQWYVKTKPLAEKAIEAVKKGKIKIVPKRFEKIYYQWLENIRDWNISRQIVWGIRIPAWECKDCGTWNVTEGTPLLKCACGSANLIQDPDVFDTWYSSGQWPFSTLGYPEGEDYKYFYPTSVLDTAYDILFFWAARMIMLGIYVTGKIPFETLYLHGLVLDAKGLKMSKSKGNVIDPMSLVDKYGADAVRMGLVVGNLPGVDQPLSESKFVAFRNFANKVWNISRFVVMGFEETAGVEVLMYSKELKGMTGEDKEIIKKLDDLVKNVNVSMKKFRLGDAGDEIYRFMWHEFADKYIESTKERLKGGGDDVAVALAVLRHVLMTSLKLLHPFMPFVTEEIWEKIPGVTEKPLITAKWPE